MSASQLELILGQVKLLPSHDLVKLIKQAAELLEQQQSVQANTINYAALFGSGQGAYASPQEADSFLRAERDQWEK